MATQYTAGLSAGQVLTASTMNSIGAAWETWTPTWSSSGTAPAIGNGTISGRYGRIQRLVFGQIAVTMGSTTTFGTGTWYFLLPLTNVTNVNAYAVLGHGYMQDASAATVYSLIGDRGNTSDKIHMRYPGGSFGDVTATAPFTWASGDTLFVNFTYEYSA